jgi:hypothetical protein
VAFRRWSRSKAQAPAASRRSGLVGFDRGHGRPWLLLQEGPALPREKGEGEAASSGGMQEGATGGTASPSPRPAHPPCPWPAGASTEQRASCSAPPAPPPFSVRVVPLLLHPRGTLPAPPPFSPSPATAAVEMASSSSLSSDEGGEVQARAVANAIAYASVVGGGEI